MNWSVREFNSLLTHDVDAVVGRARSLDGKDAAVALRDSLARLKTSAESLDRLKVLLFIQTLLAVVPDGNVEAFVAEHAVHELAKVLFSPSDSAELKRSALDALALLFIKARELTAIADSRLREAFAFARESCDPEIRDFARRVSLANAVVARRSA